jgi:hypothetical protein
MLGLAVSPLFAAGEILLGLSLTAFVAAFIATVCAKARARKLRRPLLEPSRQCGAIAA